MNITILYDNEAKDGFKAGWGFSCLIETSQNKILFDTGWDGNILLYNMEIAGIKPEKIDKIVLSHSHWDHIGGINHILKYKRKPEVYVLKSFSENLKNEIGRHSHLIEILYPKKICKDVWTTGEKLGEKTKEQSLIVKTMKGNVIVTGCAHPGIENIIKKSKFGNIYAVIGGFHDSENLNVLRGIHVVVPCHCTQKKEIIKTMFPESAKDCEVGFSLIK